MKVLFNILVLVVATVLAKDEQLCRLEDPLNAKGPFKIQPHVEPFIKLEAGSEISDVHVVGLSTLKYDFDIKASKLTGYLDGSLGKASGTAKYVVNGKLDAKPFRFETIPSGKIEGKGEAKFSAENVKVKGSATITMKAFKVQIKELNLETLSFDSITVDMGGDFKSDGKTIDWADFSKNFKANFEKDLKDHKKTILDKIKTAANEILKKFKLTDLLKFKDRKNIGSFCDAILKG